MTARQPRISGKDLLAAFKKQGYKVVNIRGSHHYLEPPGGGSLITIPVHGKDTLKPKTFKSILDQAGITIHELIEWL